MAKFVVHKNNNYTVLSNIPLKDQSLSLKSKGLLAMMLSFPDDWDYSINGLSAICKEGTDAIRNTLQELERCGYLDRTRQQNDKGQFEYVYDIYEAPHITEPHIEEPHTDNPYTVNPTQLNTYQLSTKELNTKNQSEPKDSGAGKKKKVYFPDDEVLNEAFTDFVDMRKKMKKPLNTDRALKLAINKLIKLASDQFGSMDSNKALEIINQTIEHSWQTFYPLREEEKKASGSIDWSKV